LKQNKPPYRNYQISQINTGFFHRKDTKDAKKNKKIYVCLKLLPSPPELRGTTNNTNSVNYSTI